MSFRRQSFKVDIHVCVSIGKNDMYKHVCRQHISDDLCYD